MGVPTCRRDGIRRSTPTRLDPHRRAFGSGSAVMRVVAFQSETETPAGVLCRVVVNRWV
jgi:hypothetical protein